MLEVAICDDDKEDLDKAALMLDKILSEYQVQYQIRPFLSANELLNNNDKIDIGILDISMEELGGITLGRKLKEKKIADMNVNVHLKILWKNYIHMILR